MKNILITALAAIISVNAASQAPANSIVTNSERDLIPEGIAVNYSDGTIYVSSIARHKIVAIAADGKVKDFIKSDQDGFLEGLGMKVDARKNLLWCLSNQNRNNLFSSGIHAFDTRTGKLKQRFFLKDTIKHLFNDLVIHPNGQIYLTDTYNSSIYQFNATKQTLQLMVKDPLLSYPNGIAVNQKDKIIVATSHGLIQLDIKSKEIKKLTGPAESIKVPWLDGIVYWNHAIIGVSDNAVVKYLLNDLEDEITREIVIDQDNALFREPTTIATFKDTLYLAANSCLKAYNANGESTKGIEEKLESIIVLIYQLK